ncbi:hypothetical protein L3V77_20060 [Vibrio sp. DW001]|uniref:hypothetical protein n=1 Tax=Vibrio sp. DW001 TaxID=2912315 RepID=UPI0023AFFCAF|nr:hypothetical protein [Vibrio sp. DW001]WED29709.1 hypothetical protein L3V77_20060 [Vibrio sp. DW001]
MNRPLKDEEMVSLYQQGATETTSSELDEKILGYAKQQSKKQKTWWPHIGLAASLTFVTLLAPWNWLDQTLQNPTEQEQYNALPLISEIESENQLMHDTPKLESRSIKAKKVESETLLLRSIQENASQSDASKRLMKNSETSGMTMDIPETKEHYLFAEIELLLTNGEIEKAREQLLEMLKGDPEIEEKLPQELRDLLANKPK